MSTPPAQPPTLQPADYDEYIGRFSALVGEIAEGQYGRYKGRLVPKMSRALFEERYTRYLALGVKYATMLSNNTTIEDTLTVDLKAAEVELLVQDSLFLPFPKYLG